MVLPQTMFQLLRQRLEGIAEGEANGVHGDASVQNTLWLQNLAQLEQDRSHGPADLGYAQPAVRAVYHSGTPAVKIPGHLLTLGGGPVFNNRVGREPFTQRRRTQ